MPGRQGLQYSSLIGSLWTTPTPKPTDKISPRAQREEGGQRAGWAGLPLTGDLDQDLPRTRQQKRDRQSPPGSWASASTRLGGTWVPKGLLLHSSQANCFGWWRCLILSFSAWGEGAPRSPIPQKKKKKTINQPCE